MKKKMLVLLLLLVVVFNANAIISPVFDSANLIAAIDTLYSNYDMVMNTITQIEQAYEEMQFYANEAKSWNLDDIQWDGDWDFRDEIGDVTATVNKQITNIRNIEELFTTQQYSFAGMSFTMKDLVGFGNPDKDIGNLFNQTGEYLGNSFDKVADTLVNGLSDEEKQAIMRKYGMSPKNYVYMQQKKQLVSDAVTKVVGKASAEAQKMITDQNLEGTTSIIEAISNNSEITEKELAQQTALLIQELIKNINMLGLNMNEVAALEALQATLEDEEKQQEQEAKASVMNLDKEHVSTNF